MSNVTKIDRDKQKLVQEKCQVILTDMLRDEDNKYCVDCDAKGPRWASWNLGIFLCIRCAGIHRNLGVHISKVKSVNLDSWTPEQVMSLQQMGNSRARAIYEANLPDNFRRPQTDSALESFIRAKYEAKKYIAKEWVPQPAPKVCWDAEIEQELKRKKEAKRKTGNSPATIELPAPVAVARARSTSSERKSLPNSASTQTKQSQQPVPAVVTTATAASQDLLGLETVLSTPKNEDFFGSLLDVSTHVLPVNGASSASTSTSNKSEDENSFFNQKVPNSTEKKTLDKDSILALYNQSGSGLMQNVYSAPGGPNLIGNVYGTPQPTFGQSTVMSGTSNMTGGFNVVQNNLYTSPMFNAGSQIPGNSNPSITQFSQQMSGLSLGSSPMVRPANTFQTTMPQNLTLLNTGSPVVNQVMNPATHVPTQQTYNAFFTPGQSLSSNLWQ